MVGENSIMCKSLSKIHEERLTVISLRKEVEQLKLKYAKFKKDTENVRGVFQKLIEELNQKCNRMTYFVCLQRITSKRYVFYLFRMIFDLNVLMF